MSRYHLNRFLFDLKMKTGYPEQALADLDRALSDYDLSAEEIAASRHGIRGSCGPWVLTGCCRST